MPAAFSLDPSEDGLATRQLDAGNLEVSAPGSLRSPRPQSRRLGPTDDGAALSRDRTKRRRARRRWGSDKGLVGWKLGERSGCSRSSSMTSSTVAKVYRI